MEQTTNKPAKNPYGKTTKVENPHAVYKDPRMPNWEWRILKLNVRPDKAVGNKYASALCAVKSPMTCGSWEYGDTYLTDIGHQFVSGTDVLKECGHQTTV